MLLAALEREGCVYAFWLQGQLETSPHMYKACLGKGQAPDDMVPRR